jgi:hypothetical protein
MSAALTTNGGVFSSLASRVKDFVVNLPTR